MKYTILLISTFFYLTMSAQQLPSKEKAKVISDLEKAYDLDQGTRKKFNDCAAEHGANNDACKAFRKTLEAQDSANQQVVFNIFEKYGWIPANRVSKKASKAFFYVLQHAPLEAQARYAHMVDTAFNRKEISPVEYAFFVDRLRSKQGKAQLYGTQTATDNLGNSYLYPVENWPLADSLRVQLGAPPLDEFLKTSGLSYPMLPKTDFRDHAIIIGHIWGTNNKGIDSVKVSIASKYIGASDANGFFLLEIEKNMTDKITLTLVKPGFKIVTYPVDGNKDFHEIFVMLR